MSDRSATSSGDFSGSFCPFSPFFSLVCGSGDVKALLGLELSACGVVPFPSDGDVGFDPKAADGLLDKSLFASRFSRVPRSVAPLSFSSSNPKWC